MGHPGFDQSQAKDKDSIEKDNGASRGLAPYRAQTSGLADAGADGLGFGIELERFVPHLAAPARLLVAAEG